VLTSLVAQKRIEEQTTKHAIAPLEELRRRRLLIPEGSGRAVTPDCPRIPRGSDETVERQDDRLPNTYELLAPEADYLLALFSQVFGDS
jgi:hypothetical protein